MHETFVLVSKCHIIESKEIIFYLKIKEKFRVHYDGHGEL